MAKALKAVGTAIIIVGAIAATGGAALALGAGATLGGALGLASSAVLSVGGFSVSAGALLTVGSLVSSVGGSLSQPKVSTAGNALGWVGDPNGPMHFAAGRIAVAGDLRHKKAYGPNDRMYFSAVTVVSDAGPITEFESFTANDIPVTFDVNGKANSSYYANVMWRRTQLGTQPEASYLASPSGLEGGATLPNWGASHKLSAKAAFILTFSENSKQSAYKGQYAKPRHVIRGLKAYDWRLDSTYPGGSGPHRLDQPATWTYTANPILWAVKWILGLWEGPAYGGAPQLDTQVGGMGVKVENIDLPAFTEAANIADTHGWTCAAWPSTDDDKAQVLDAFLQAGGAYYIQRGGKESCLHRAAPRVSVATISASDTAGALELDTGASFTQRKNCGVPTYLSEADGWKMTALGQVSSPQWVEEDGGRERSAPVTYSYVSSAQQAAELMCLSIAHTREGIRGRLPLKPYMQGIQPGSAFTITEPEFVLNGLKCLCLETSYDAQTGIHTVTFVSESDGKYDFAFGQSPNPPAPPALEAVDPTFVTPPLPGDWVITPRPPSGDGTQQPGFDLTGLVSNATATAVIVEWGPTADGPWTQAYAGPPDVTSIPIVGLQSGATYFIAVRYQRNSNFSDRYVYGPYVAPTLTAGISPETVEDIVRDVVDQVDTDIGEGIQAGRDALVRARDNALLILQNAKNALEGTLKEEEGRQTQTDDLQDRIDIGFLIDPIAKTGIIRTQVQVEGLNETFVQVNTRLVARDAENALQTAQVALDARAYTNDKVSVATANLVTAAQMGTAISGAVLSMRSYADDKVATATAGLVAVSQMNTAIATSELSLQSYTNGKISEATAGLATSASVATAIASSDLALRSYTDGQISEATADLISAAGVDGKIATASLALRSYTDGQISTATAGLATVVQMNSAISTSALSLQSWTNGRISEATAGLATSAQVATAISASEMTLKSYTDGQISTATANLISAAGVDSKIATASLALSSQTDSKIATATANLISASQLAAALAGSELSLKSYTDGQISTATALLASKAEVNTRGNALPNSTGANAWAGWSKSPSWEVIYDATWGARFETSAAGTTTNVSDPLAVSAGASYVLSADFLFTAGSGSVVVDVAWETAGGSLIGYSSRIFAASARNYGERLSTALTAPGNASSARVRFFGENVGNNTRIGVRRIKLERGAMPATAWTDDATDVQLAATAAIQADAIADAATKLSQARLRLITAAEGGQPATVELFSDSEGSSYVRLGAKQIGFGDNTTFDDATDTLRTTIGSVRIVQAWGAPFGGADSLIYWRGPASVAVGQESKANVGAGSWEDSAFRSFFGGQTVSFPFDSGAPNATPIDLLVTTEIASTPMRLLQTEGLIAVQASYEVFISGAGSGENSDFTVQSSFLIKNPDGSNAGALGLNFGSVPRNVWTQITVNLPVAALDLGTRGERRFTLNVAGVGADVRTPQARNGRIRGIYGA